MAVSRSSEPMGRATSPASKTHLSTRCSASRPGCRAISIFNGALDLAVSRFGNSNKVSILLGNGDGSFQAPVDLLRWNQQADALIAAGEISMATVSYGSGCLRGTRWHGKRPSWQWGWDVSGSAGLCCRRLPSGPSCLAGLECAWPRGYHFLQVEGSRHPAGRRSRRGDWLSHRRSASDAGVHCLQPAGSCGFGCQRQPIGSPYSGDMASAAHGPRSERWPQSPSRTSNGVSGGHRRSVVRRLLPTTSSAAILSLHECYGRVAPASPSV